MLSYDADDPAEPLSDEELQRIRRLIGRLEHLDFGGTTAFVGNDGVGVVQPDPTTFEAFILDRADFGLSSGTPGYPFAEAFFDEAVQDWVTKPGGIATPTSGEFVLAFERNGNAEVPPGKRVEVKRVGLLSFGFTLPAAALAVEELDGSPSVSPVTTLQFDQSSGLAVTNPSAGVALVTFAGDDVPRDEGRATTVDIRRPFGASTPTTSNVACTIYEDLYRGRGGATGTNYLTWSHFFDFASTVDVRDATSRGAGSTLFSYADGDQLNEPTGAGHTSYVVVWVTKLVQGGTTIKRAYCMRDAAVWPGP